MAEKEKSLEKNKTIRSINESKTPSYALLGHYIPVHKHDKTAKIDLATKTISSEAPKFCIYDGDYFGNSTITEKDLYGNFSGNFFKFMKYIFLNLPVINFLYLKLKQAKIKESISTLDTINEDVDKLVNFFEGKSVINEQKYQKICEELIKANNIQSKIKKEILADN